MSVLLALVTLVLGVQASSAQPVLLNIPLPVPPVGFEPTAMML